MTVLQRLRRLYSLDTLDTRFTVSSNIPLKAVGDDQPPRDERAQAIANAAPPSKWQTPEFYFYYFVFLTVVPLMFKIAIDVSQGLLDARPHDPKTLRLT
jgi:protein-cysteine N-palmitoyltransferase HHAT